MSWKIVAAHYNTTESCKTTSPYYDLRVELVISGSDSDVTLDLDNFSGTFWTAALADATYGTTAASVKSLLNSLTGSIAALVRVGGNFTLYRPRVMAGSEVTGTYSQNYNDTAKLPNFAFKDGNGCGGTNIILDYEMNPGFLPIQGNLPATVAAYTAP